MPQMAYVFQKTGLPSVAPDADPGELVDTPFLTKDEAEAAASSYCSALNTAWSPDDVYTFVLPQYTPLGVAPERFAVFIDELAPPGVPVPDGARLEEIGDPWYQPAW